MKNFSNIEIENKIYYENIFACGLVDEVYYAIVKFSTTRNRKLDRTMKKLIKILRKLEKVSEELPDFVSLEVNLGVEIEGEENE